MEINKIFVAMSKIDMSKKAWTVKKSAAIEASWIFSTRFRNLFISSIRVVSYLTLKTRQQQMGKKEREKCCVYTMHTAAKKMKKKNFNFKKAEREET